jgi:hypothetical protein
LGLDQWDGFPDLSFEEVLLPRLIKKGKVVVMDNLSAHKGERVRELIEAKGCELVYLPQPIRRTSIP